VPRSTGRPSHMSNVAIKVLDTTNTSSLVEKEVSAWHLSIVNVTWLQVLELWPATAYKSCFHLRGLLPSERNIASSRCLRTLSSLFPLLVGHSQTPSHGTPSFRSHCASPTMARSRSAYSRIYIRARVLATLQISEGIVLTLDSCMA
jgi:hypothetical protein